MEVSKCTLEVKLKNVLITQHHFKIHIKKQYMNTCQMLAAGLLVYMDLTSSYTTNPESRRL